MIHIFTALYCEALIFIRHFKLIKNQENTCFQEFYNETAGICLTVTGVGEIAAASAVSSAYTAYRPAAENLLLNVGICAHTKKNNGIFLCNKIIESATNKTFYPDMLFRHSFCEGTIVTGMIPWSSDPVHTGTLTETSIEMLPWNGDKTHIMIPTATPAEMLYDMEAAAIYQAGIRFLGPHQMIFLKIVSDNGTTQEVSSEQAIQLMEKYQDCIFDYIGQLSAITQENKHHKDYLHSGEEALLETFCTDMHCSKAMRDSMRQYIRYLSLSNIDYATIIQNMYKKGLLPCKDKREGKQRFEEFKQKLF